jgi:uncharacterized protein (DUF924 family)
MNHDAQAVLDFWFGAPGSPEHGIDRPEWFRKDASFDARIRERFGPLIAAVMGGARFGAAPQETLAAIIVLDQFSRNVHRDTPLAFAGDAHALALAQAMTARGADHGLPVLQRSFVYLPFEHAEDAALQDRSVRCFEALAAAAPAMRDRLDYAIKHRDVIRRFGRFPHRNQILGRESTPEEIAFLAEPGSRF